MSYSLLCRRPLIRYRLMTLFAIIAIVNIPAATYGYHRRAVQRQEEAFRQIVAKRGIVEVYSYGTTVLFEAPPALYCRNGILRVIEPNEVGQNFADEDCALLDKIINLHSVHFSGSKISTEFIIDFVCRHPNCRVSNKPFSEFE